MANQKTNLPNGWKKTTLGTIASFNYGKSLNAKTRINGDVPVYGSSGITGYHNEALVKEPGYIIGRKGTVGSIHYSGVPFFPIDTAFYLTRKDIKIDFRYFYYLLKTMNLDRLNFDSAVPGLNRDVAYSLHINIPECHNEQRAISAVLSSLDDKVKLLREQNETLEGIAKAIFKEWFVNFNFPQQDGTPYKSNSGEMIASELGEIPEGWKVGKIDCFIEKHTISYRCIQSDLSKMGQTPIIDQGASGIYGYTERNPDFQANSENPVILFANHTCNMWFANYPFCAIQNIIPFRGNSEYSTFFVYYMTLGRVKFIEYKGHWPDFEQKKYVIPTPELANKFAEIVKPLQHKIWSNSSQIQTISALRDTLLPKLMSGQLSVGKV